MTAKTDADASAHKAELTAKQAEIDALSDKNKRIADVARKHRDGFNSKTEQV